jgi:hypothetical protein
MEQEQKTMLIEARDYGRARLRALAERHAREKLANEQDETDFFYAVLYQSAVLKSEHYDPMDDGFDSLVQ